ncbi:hypothetical protein Glove_228g24 [Diversispora epigaea]|uniref:Uncharacterized protein n=1 Tax=Diversispora epigaea TaxID=1348612 RepID=A0A397IDX5_9GLOM|nr:hypothetical protein Glove_228g24 [Diversispora epigaea]
MPPSRRSFAIKLLCEELPTLSRRYVHKSNLYNSSSCVLCDELIEEDNMHVFTCKRKGNIDPIKGLNNKFKEILMERIKKEESNIDIKVIWEHINEIDILNYSYEKDYTLSKNYSDLTFFDVIKEVNNGITNKDKRIKQTKEKLNTNNQVVKTSNIRKRNNYNINNLKIIEEKEYIQNKQKQKKTNLEFFPPSRRSFAIKLLCEELPTLSRRYVHKSNLYNSSSCVLCDELIEEDNMHVFTCKRKGNIDPIKGLNNKFKEILMERIKKEESNIDIKVIWEHINEIDILNYSYEKDYTLSKNYSDLTFFDVIKEVNNGITNKDKRIKQTKEKLNTNNQVVKTSNIRKRNNYNINNLKIIEEKEYIQNKQKQKKTNLEFFVNESFLNTNTYKGNNLYKIKIFSDGDMAISS